MVSPGAHPLKLWLEANGFQSNVASRHLQVSVVTISRWFSGDREMRVENRIAVESMTDGDVTRSQIEDWQAHNLKRLTRKPRNSVGAAAAG